MTLANRTLRPGESVHDFAVRDAGPGGAELIASIPVPAGHVLSTEMSPAGAVLVWSRPVGSTLALTPTADGGNHRPVQTAAGIQAKNVAYYAARTAGGALK